MCTNLHLRQILKSGSPNLDDLQFLPETVMVVPDNNGGFCPSASSKIGRMIELSVYQIKSLQVGA